MVFQKDFEIHPIMARRFKSYPNCLSGVEFGKNFEETGEPCSIICDREGVTDDFTLMIHDEAIVFVFGNVNANKVGHKDTS
jgi:hypothetical protein